MNRILLDHGPTVGRCLSAIVSLALLADAGINLLYPQALLAEMQTTGFSESHSQPLGIIMLVCVGLYIVPRTSFLGAILITGFLGGAICAHFRLGEWASPPQLISFALGVATWGGLYLSHVEIRHLFAGRWLKGS